MTKFFYITDTHFGASPRCRKDDYNKAILAKIEFVLALCRKNKCILLIGGDLFDRPKINFIELNRLIRLFIKYKDVQVYCLHGNESHDGLEQDSPLSFLKEAGVLLSKEPFIDFEDIRVIFENSSDENGEDYIKENSLNMLMTHKTITVEPVIFDHVLMEEYSTNADIVTVGHYHPYQGVVRRDDGVVFIAPGALARKKNIDHDKKRDIKGVYIVIDDKKIKTIKEVDIPHEKDVWTDRKVLDIDDETMYNEIQSEVDNMKTILDEQQGFMSLEDHVRFYAKKRGLSEEHLNFALEILGGKK